MSPGHSCGIIDLTPVNWPCIIQLMDRNYLDLLVFLDGFRGFLSCLSSSRFTLSTIFFGNIVRIASSVVMSRRGFFRFAI